MDSELRDLERRTLAGDAAALEHLKAAWIRQHELGPSVILYTYRSLAGSGMCLALATPIIFKKFGVHLTDRGMAISAEEHVTIKLETYQNEALLIRAGE